ncbi:uncharacterized protein [Fopius arisanus]|uniref:C2H2-type domain-containing protein n=1 Tax=Fopius arisanus TaxID=64838 RepID=A0A9R1U7V4_9HYME|nr:PREDICTED: uncharacterized protein LOC105272041 [Fopius arisanus]
MSQINLPQSYTWDDQFEDGQEVNRTIPDEVISIYEVYVKEDSESQDGKCGLSLVPGSLDNDHLLINGGIGISEDDIDGEVVDGDGNTSKVFVKDSIDSQGNKKKSKVEEKKLKSLSDTPYSQTNGENSAIPQIIDKDDPRSRLHFVKYLKREGKTIKIWECGICSKEFRHQYTLMRHLPTHTDERNFKCDACGKAFRQLSTLSQHKAIHSDARPYVCEYCKKTFNRVSTLISHRKTHSENKPHKCPVCGKGFHQKGNLRNHVFTHTNERPYKCETCGKGFNQMSNLVCHKVKAHAHTERMQYSCGICGKEFPRRFSLRSHEETKHGIKYRNSSVSQNGSERNRVKQNLRIIELSSEDSMDTEDKENRDTQKIETFYVDKIITKAMTTAVMRNQVPFALFKPIRGIPVLVKVTDAGEKHMLTPATPEDLRVNGTMSSPEGSCEGEKGQMKISVVATVTQTPGIDGKFSFSVEPPDPDEDHVENFLVPKMDEEVDKPIPFIPEPSSISSTSPSLEDCSELMELAAQGGIQFVRATEDGRYEVMSNSEARDLMAQNSHDVTILEGPEAEAISVMQANTRSTTDDIIIGDQDNQIMVLDAGANQKSLDSIEILDPSAMGFFGQSKIDDFIMGQRGFEGIPLPSEDDLMVPHDFSSLLHHQPDLSFPSHPPPYPPQDSFAFLKAPRLPPEDFSILGVDSNYLEEGRMRLQEFDDVMDDVQSNLRPMTPEMRPLGHHSSTKLETGSLPSFAETKALGPKYQEFEAASQYHEIKIFNTYDQGLRGGYCSYNGDIDGNYQSGSRVFGKRMCEDQEKDDKSEGILKPIPSSSRSLPIIPEADEGRNVDRISDQLLLQANTLTDPDFLSFESRSMDSPGNHLPKSFTLDGLPDLN